MRKTSKSKPKKVTTITRKGLKPGKRAIAIALSKAKRKSLVKGQTLVITVVAKDAAGNTTTTITTKKIR